MIFFKSWMKMFGRLVLLLYIDAGTGSLIIQILIGSTAGILLALKMSWKRFKNWVTHNHSLKENLEEAKEPPIEQ